MITPHFRVGSLIRLLHYCDFNDRAVMRNEYVCHFQNAYLQIKKASERNAGIAEI